MRIKALTSASNEWSHAFHYDVYITINDANTLREAADYLLKYAWHFADDGSIVFIRHIVRIFEVD